MKLLPRLFLTLFFVCFLSGKDHLTSGTNFTTNEILSCSENQELHKILSANRISRLDSLLNAFTAGKGFQGSVLVAIDGYNVFERTAGFADPIRKTPADPAAVYQLASVSKQFTAAAILLLNADNRLALDDYVTKYIPELPYPKVKISHLLHHTAGLPNYMYLVDKYWARSGAPDNEDVIYMLQKYRLPAFFQPGTRYDYSNTGYVVLASVVERITGMSFNEFLQRRVFIPLGMKNTYVYSSADTSMQRLHIGGFHTLKRGFSRIGESRTNGPVGDKGVCSTARDLFLWDQALYTDFPIGQPLLREAFRSGLTNAGKAVNYGYGFRIREYADSPVIYHNGVWEGFRTNFHRYPENHNTIIVLNNTSTRLNHELVNQIEAIIHDSPVSDITKTLIQLAIDEGGDEALDAYEGLKEDGRSEFVEIQRIAEVADFMQRSEKPNKASEIRKLLNKIGQDAISRAS